MTIPRAGTWADLRWGRWATLGASVYVVIVAVTAAVGFVTESTRTILSAALFAAPASLVAVPGYYLAYGALAWVPGANPSTDYGSATCAPSGACHGFEVGHTATWFTITTDVLGILALSAGAMLNVAALWLLTARRGHGASSSALGR